MQDVYVVGAYSTIFKKWPERSYRDLVREAYLGMLEDAGLETGEQIDFGYFGNVGLYREGQASIRGQICFIPLVREGLFPERVPMINVEGACATASMAFHSAWKDIRSGESKIVMAMGAEKLFYPDDPAGNLKFMGVGMDNFTPEETLDVYRDIAERTGSEFNPGPDRSLFMDTYALQARYHMHKYGTTKRQIAIAAAHAHNYGAQNPKAQYQFPMTPEQVLEDRPITEPLTRAMCAPIGDGASATLLCAADMLSELPKAAQDRAIKICATTLSGGKYRDPDEPSLAKAAADAAYAKSGVKPEQINLAEVHDATAFSQIYQAELLGFCPIGEGGKFVEDGQTGPGGKVPINTSGGLVSKGHPVGATGISMIAELVQQLRGEAGERQVPDAEFALAENGGGVIGLEEAAASVVILQRDR